MKKMSLLAIVVAAMGIINLQAMQPEAKPKAAEPTVVQDLFIKNNWDNKLLVQYVRGSDPNPIKAVITPGNKLFIENVRNVIDLRFEAHGQYLGYLNFKTSPNYRININELLSKDHEDDILITVGMGSKEEQPAKKPERSQPAQSLTGALWQMGSSAYSKLKETAVYYGEKAVSTVGPFKVEWTAKPKGPVEYMHPEFFEGRYIYQELPSVEARIQVGLPVLGRHILDVPAGASVASIEAARDYLRKKWEADKQNAIRRENPRAVLYIDRVLDLINEASRDINREFPKQRFEERG